MIWKSVTLDLSTEQIANLKAQNVKVIKHLEDGFPLRLNVLEALKTELTQIANATPALAKTLDEVHRGGDHCAVQLLHSDNEILNLPWSLAVDNLSGQALGAIQQLALVKCLSQQVSEAKLAAAAPPLKILIMISSPEDAEWKSRLSFEDEEFHILRAFEPLMQRGQVEIDFTDDGSLQALESKLKNNKYHVLHFSGHGIYKDGTGYLLLENPLTLKTAPASEKEFVDALNCNPDHKIPLVVLSSCQTAQGGSEQGLRGITNHLLMKGFPAVIAMGLSIQDIYAAHFAAHFYGQLAEKQPLPSAFKSAVEFLRQQEFDDLAKAHVQHPVPLQWMIPNLYLTQNLEHLVNWGAPQEALALSSYRFITEQNRLLLQHDKEYVFVGRRRDKARLLAPFFAKTPSI